MPEFGAYPEKESPAEGDFLLVLDGDDAATKKVDVANLLPSLPTTAPFAFDLASWSSGDVHCWAATNDESPYYAIYASPTSTAALFGAYINNGTTGRVDLTGSHVTGSANLDQSFVVYGANEASAKFARTSVNVGISDVGTNASAALVCDVDTGESVFVGIANAVPKIGLYDASNQPIFEVISPGGSATTGAAFSFVDDGTSVQQLITSYADPAQDQVAPFRVDYATNVPALFVQVYSDNGDPVEVSWRLYAPNSETAQSNVTTGVSDTFAYMQIRSELDAPMSPFSIHNDDGVQFSVEPSGAIGTLNGEAVPITDVAVTAAGIHAALVTLGLITT